MTKVPTNLFKDVATATTDDGTSLDTANSGKVVQLNSLGAIPSVYFAPMVDHWYLTANVGASANPIAANLSRFTKMGGTGVTESNGIFTFPVTGFYRMDATIMAENRQTDAQAATGYIQTSTNVGDDTPTWSIATECEVNLTNQYDFGCIILTAFVDVTSIADVGVNFRISHTASGNRINGDASITKTHFTFTRIGDT